MINFSSIFWILAGGFLPAILWLVFWLREDSRNPESNILIIKTFLAGSVAVILVLPFESFVSKIFPGMGVITFTLWVILEESFKFLAAYFIAIRSQDDNEPVDPMIYMITAALGFAALENALFIFQALIHNTDIAQIVLTQKDIMNGVIAGNMRFIGASLLHTLSSATIGVAIAINFYKNKAKRVLWGIFAFIIAIFIHTAFNIFIYDKGDLGVFLTFGTVWAGVTLLILMFEKVKSITPQKSDETISTGDSSLQN